MAAAASAVVVQAVCDFVHRHIESGYQHARLEGFGVWTDELIASPAGTLS